VVGEDWRALSAVYWSRFRPDVVLAPSAAKNTTIPLLEGRGVTGETLAYHCRDFVCDLPTSDPGVLAEQLA
jgi:hypothetical protein